MNAFLRVFRTTAGPPVLLAGLVFAALLVAGCPPAFPPDGGEASPPVYNNTTDKTNNGADFVGSAACSACHPEIAAVHFAHGHAHKLTPVQGAPPAYPAQGTRAAVPDPPDGFEWTDIAYVIGGYTKKARFVDLGGYILTTGVAGVNTQWNLDFPPNGNRAGFVAYEPGATAPKPYDFSCFQCHTTGPAEQRAGAAFPEFQDNRPGLMGTWEEPSIQCEACHGPGSNHIPNPSARNLFVDPTGAATCNACHNRPYDSQTGEIPAGGGYIQHHEQWPELRASGGHASFPCTTCHDPHASVIYDRAAAVRTDCTACHADMDLAFHEGKVFTRGAYREPLACESCHMPFATKSASAATPEIVGTSGRMGDTRTHIFRIDTRPVDFSGMFTGDGGQVVRDAQGRAAVTVDFVCLRCHTEDATVQNSAFPLSVESAAEIALGMHRSAR